MVVDVPLFFSALFCLAFFAVAFVNCSCCLPPFWRRAIINVLLVSFPFCALCCLGLFVFVLLCAFDVSLLFVIVFVIVRDVLCFVFLCLCMLCVFMCCLCY